MIFFAIILLLSGQQSQREIDSVKTHTIQLRVVVDNLSQSQSRLAHQLDSTNVALVSSQRDLERLQQNSNDSQKGSILIIIGLALEILGATALAGSYLGRKFVDITNFSYSVSAFDLGLTDPDRESILWMIGLLGIFLLVLGFAGQFIGSLFAITHTWFTSRPSLWLCHSLDHSPRNLTYSFGPRPNSSRESLRTCPKHQVVSSSTFFKRSSLLVVHQNSPT